MRAFERITLDGKAYEVLSLTDDGRPQKVRVRFDRPLQSNSLRFMQWADHGHVAFTLPLPGQTATVPEGDLYQALAGAL